MKTVAYLRVSTGGQDVATQKLAILDYAPAIASQSLSSSKLSSPRALRGNANRSSRRSKSYRRVIVWW